ncbi:MAG TPA: LamB/YcsF family protein [Acidimicrobiia bacterium]|nr:LamB/YcsF family protein [Acidimicrobiia bacterium]
MRVEINCDMGEAFGLYRMGDDEAIMPYVTAANVACGFHASDPVVMWNTVRLAKKHGVKVGAHPAYPDLQGFGRREMKMDPAELSACMLYQIGALKAFLDAEGMPLNHIKPHGALYGVAARDEAVANAIADAAEPFGVPLYGMAGTLHEQVFTSRGLGFVAEFFTDLDYGDDGSLIITRVHEAKDPDTVVERTLRAVTEGKATSINGSEIPMRADSVCVHSDTPGAVDLAVAVHSALQPYLEGN